MSKIIYARIYDKLKTLYGDEQADNTLSKLKTVIEQYDIQTSEPTLPVNEADVILITYGDQVQNTDENPLAVQHRFLKETVYPVVNNIHLLPFFPYSSDDGFSVIDYMAVNPEHGTWDDITNMGKDFKLMFDAVFNHISAHSEWFQAFLRGENPYTDYFVVMNPDVDLSAVVRPRTLPLLTPVQTPDGEKYVWTTFSDDQIDLNIMNPAVLVELVKILLFYVEKGAKLIRLDAIAFLWKIAGTNSLHLEQTHLVIQLMRNAVSLVAPDVMIVTETNVPHEENISYFGDGTNEAHMVYQFPLPPLILHTMTVGDTTKLTQWADGLQPAGEYTTFFNFIASHDGIGLRPVTGILSDDEIQKLADLTQAHGGNVSFKNNSDGSQSPYELNISYFDAVNAPELVETSQEIAVKRFIVSQAIGLCLAGVPGIYFHSLFGSQNDTNGVTQTGRYRSINREKNQLNALQAELADNTSLRAQVFSQYHHLLSIRREQSAFHPAAQQTILTLNPAVFAVKRYNKQSGEHILAINNVTENAVTLQIDVKFDHWHDLVQSKDYAANDKTIEIMLEAYQVIWLKP
jgi:glucosylglycerate phosphorylase